MARDRGSGTRIGSLHIATRLELGGGCILPIAGSLVADPWGMKLRPKRGRDGEEKREKWDSDDIFEPLNCAVLEIIPAHDFW